MGRGPYGRGMGRGVGQRGQSRPVLLVSGLRAARAPVCVRRKWPGGRQAQQPHAPAPDSTIHSRLASFGLPFFAADLGGASFRVSARRLLIEGDGEAVAMGPVPCVNFVSVSLSSFNRTQGQPQPQQHLSTLTPLNAAELSDPFVFPFPEGRCPDCRRPFPPLRRVEGQGETGRGAGNWAGRAGEQ